MDDVRLVVTYFLLKVPNTKHVRLSLSENTAFRIINLPVTLLLLLTVGDIVMLLLLLSIVPANCHTSDNFALASSNVTTQVVLKSSPLIT